MKRALVLLVGIALGGCAPGSPPDDSPSAAAESMQSALLAAVAGKDPAAVVDLFADSAVVHAPNGTLTVGKQAIGERIAAQFPRVKGYQIGPRNLEVGGDLAYGHATFKVMLDPGPNGDPQDLFGLMVVVMKRQADRSWKLIEVGSWISEPPEMDHDMAGMDHDMPGMTHDMPGMTHDMPGMTHDTAAPPR